MEKQYAPDHASHTAAFSGRRIKQLMRLHRVTISDIATHYGLTLTRVRYVREHGGPWDWPIMIEHLSKRPRANISAAATIQKCRT